MVETKEKEKISEKVTDRMAQNAEHAFNSIGDTWMSVLEQNRKTLQAMIQYNREAITNTYDYTSQIQREGVRLADVWIDNVSKFQKEYFKNVQDYTGRCQELAEKTIRDHQNRIEESIDHSVDLVNRARPNSYR